MTSERFARLRARMADENVDAVLVGPSADFQYLTGLKPPLPTRLTLLVVPQEGTVQLVTPSLEAAGHELDRAIEPVPWDDGDDPAAIVAACVDGARRVAVSDRVWARHLLPLLDRLERTDVVPAQPLLGPLRAVKDAGEVDALAEAGRVVSDVVAHLEELEWQGRSEREVAAEIARRMRDVGHEEVSFVILASGPNSANPHGLPTDRRVERGDVVQVDIGGKVGAYSSDISRVVVVGEPTDEFRRVYEVVVAAHDAALAAVRPGTTAESVDAAARGVIAEAGYGEQFLHRTGHGIGLDEHEEPFIVAGNAEPLQVGHAFSIEPGIYLAGRFGARLENIVAVEESGPRVLTSGTKDFVLV
jgi:Xaa-Pro aminopeptidase